MQALLVDEDLADQIWEAWDRRLIDDKAAMVLWCMSAKSNGHNALVTEN